MADEIARLTGDLAQDPSSLAFLSLAETLRRRGRLDAALRLAERGLARYPAIADAHDLVARIHADLGHGDAAFDAWTSALLLDPDHLGSHKGLAFLAFRSGDLTRCRKHLEHAARLAPDDADLGAAAARVAAAARAPQRDAETTARAVDPLPGAARTSAPSRVVDDRATNALEAPRMAPPPDVPLPPPAPTDQATLVFDHQGRVLRGAVTRPDGVDASDAVAAALAGVSRDTERAVRLLGLGEWTAVAVEGGPVNYEIRAATPEALLLVMRGREVPAGRLSRIAERAAADARLWLEELA